MLQAELCKHPDINHVAYSPHTYFETHHWLKAACVLGMPKQLFADNQVYQGYGSKANARAYVVDCIEKNVSDFVFPENDRDLVFTGWEALCRQFARPVFFEKSPQHLAQWASLTLLLEWIHATDFDVRVIGLVRNPLSVQYSAQKLFYTDPHRRQFGWADMHCNMLSFQALLEAGQFILITYEDLVTDPLRTFRNICLFIGVEPSDAVGRGVHIQSINKWKDDLSFAVRLHPSVKQIARHFGYSDDDLDNPPKPAPSQYQLFREWMQARYVMARARLWDRVVKPLRLRIKGRKA